MADECSRGIDDLLGQFRGKGTWRDSAGNTGDKAPGVLEAYGFTNRNSYGNYIMWHEELERVPGGSTGSGTFR